MDGYEHDRGNILIGIFAASGLSMLFLYWAMFVHKTNR